MTVWMWTTALERRLRWNRDSLCRLLLPRFWFGLYIIHVSNMQHCNIFAGVCFVVPSAMVMQSTEGGDARMERGYTPVVHGPQRQESSEPAPALQRMSPSGGCHAQNLRQGT